MENESSYIKRIKSPINYDYATIKVTQSRLDKGLIAIPVSLTDKFPAHNENIKVYLNDATAPELKTYSSYSSSTREARINGLRDWFEQDIIKSGDEIVIQFIDEKNHIYRLVTERKFITKTQELETSLDTSDTEEKASGKIATLADWTKSDKSKVAFSEYYRLIDSSPLAERHYVERRRQARENVPAGIRMVLSDIYKGHCQLCDFSFLKRDGQPYFETHHLDPHKGHHPKNIAVVCGNCHNQFEYANVKQEFDDNAWLVKVAFNEIMHPVRQVILEKKPEGFFKDTFTV
jgi:hypothetical protein